MAKSQKSVIVTDDALRSLFACENQVALFSRLYPDGLRLPARNPARQAVLDAAARSGLNVDWWLKHALSSGIAREWYESGALRRESHYRAGRPCDAADGTAAFRWWNESGALRCEEHYRDGRLNDSADGTAAIREWHESGALRSESHYRAGLYHDAADGTAALRAWDKSGALRRERYARELAPVK